MGKVTITIESDILPTKELERISHALLRAHGEHLLPGYLDDETRAYVVPSDEEE